MRHLLLATILAALPLAAQPVATTLRNDASLAPRGMKNWPVAPGSIIRINGQRLGPDPGVSADPGPLPTELAGVSVTLQTPSAAMPALLFSVSDSEIRALVPSTFPPNESATAIVRVNGRTANNLIFSTQPANFGIYTKNGLGAGPAAAKNLIEQDGLDPLAEDNSLLKPATPGQAITLYGTGLGATSEEGKGDLPDLPLQIYIGNTRATIRQQGRAECCFGQDRVVAVVPPGTEGCYIPVVARIRDILSNVATISISRDGSPCDDPTGLTADELTKLTAQGTARIGTVQLGRYVDEVARNPGASEFARASFSRYDTPSLLQSYGIFGLPAPGTCVGTAEYPAPFLRKDPTVPERMDAGAALTLAGPRGTKKLANDGSGVYAAELRRAPESDPNLYLTPGDYTLDNGDGGADVGAFRLDFRVPQPFVWTNKSGAAPVLRTSAATVDWTGGTPNDFIVLTEHIENRIVGLNVICVERASAGTFTQPKHLDEIAPIENPIFGGLPGTLGFAPAFRPIRFNAPGIDLGLLFISIGEGVFSP